MARMLQIMLIIGIIDDALQVAFIVAHLHGKFIDIIHIYYLTIYYLILSHVVSPRCV